MGRDWVRRLKCLFFNWIRGVLGFCGAISEIAASGRVWMGFAGSGALVVCAKTSLTYRLRNFLFPWGERGKRVVAGREQLSHSSQRTA